MRFEIRPFNETTDKSDVTSPSNAAEQRATSFMDSLHARINSLDEAQREKWAKNAEAAAIKRKPVRRVRPEADEGAEEAAPKPKARKAAPAKSGKKPARRRQDS